MQFSLCLKKSSILLLVSVVFGLHLTSNTFAHDPKLHSENVSQAVTITGEVIDPGCFFIHGARGIEHKSCAQSCAKAGTTLAVLDERTDTLYIPISPEHEKNPNGKLLEFAGERVTVTGQSVVKHGYHAIVIKSVNRVGGKK